MIWSLSFDPLVPLWLLGTGSVLALVLSALLFYLGLRGAFLRMLALALLLVGIANPSLYQEDRTPLSTVVALVTDRSQSQKLDGRAQDTEEARAAIAEKIEVLEGFDLREVGVETATGLRNDGTVLFSALADSLSDVPPERIGGAIVITDGQIHDVPESASQLGFEAPLHAVITGHPEEIDRRLRIVSAPKFGLVGSRQPVMMEAVQSGNVADADQTAMLTIRHNGSGEESRIVEVNEPFEVTIEIGHGGQNLYEFEISAVDNELTTINNRSVVSVDGIRENLRVLLVSGSPHAGERTWRNLLKSDAAVDLVHFTILRPPEKQDGTPINQLSLIAFPTRELFSVKIDEFDLIIFDRYERRGVLPLLYFDNIAQFVMNGGAVLVSGGPDYADISSIYQTPLSRILPAAPTGQTLDMPYHPQISELGERHPVTRQLPGADESPPAWSRWFRLVDSTLTSGQNLMTGADDRPLLVLDRVGDGRVATLLSDHVWLWARGYEGGGPHVTLLRRLAHWLMQEPDLSEEALRLQANGQELQIERQTLSEQVDPVVLTSPSGETEVHELEAIEPGLWRKTVAATELGLYEADDGVRRALINVGPANPKEFLEVISTDNVLAPLVEATNGGTPRLRSTPASFAVPDVTALGEANSYHGSGWIGLKRTDASVLNGIRKYPLFAGFLGLALLLLVLSAMWYREGR
ncbi:hypothetical protein [Pseudovibrio sp. SPO723]|uniref:hypothetical protein n=1 Tax=Nesiotobacter zosterae TaxID=392721 RepID=UPI0029C2591D|nr:hypothetical protein [Pseudovibrio sp. SPO723]MDX5595348.1 hypothetical protein [Pseudovibrio sp. SPO723]